MSVIGSNILAGASGQGGGYNLTRSLRFRSSASAYLNRTPASAGNRQKWTVSFWCKRGTLGTNNSLMQAGTTGNQITILFFGADDKLYFHNGIQGTSTESFGVTSAVYRDPSAWYHIVFGYDTTQATASNRVFLYVNGVAQTLNNNGANYYPSQNYNTATNNTVAQYFGYGYTNSGIQYLDTYLTEVNFIDGQALTPSSFGQTSPTTGVWQPKKYAGTYGTNGFYLPFTNNSTTTTLGNDFSGNGNNWTTNNISLTAGATYDSMTDVPTLTSATASNYCVLNPLNKGSGITLASANLNATSSATYGTVLGTIGVSSGKYYWEVLINSSAAANTVGIGDGNTDVLSYLGKNNNLGYTAGGIIYGPNDTTTQSGLATYTTNDIIGVALNMDASEVKFYKNNTLVTTVTGLSATSWFPALGDNSGSSDLNVIANFGQRPFAYTPPTGFVALNTFNLPTPTIGATASTQANKYFDASLYTGNGTSQTITNSGSMSPDFVWVKIRSGAGDHYLADTLRGVSTALYTNNTDAERTEAGRGITAFNSNGFSLGLDPALRGSTNLNGATYVGWQWDAGSSTVTNTAGSITSTVSANTSSGFSIVTYTGTGTAGTVGHGLGVAPRMIIVKRRNSAVNWAVYNANIGNTNFLQLNTTVNATAQGGNNFWNSTNPTSTVFSVGTVTDTNASGGTYVAYCFAAVAGYSAFGSYTGNGSSDGTFVFTGFMPRYVMIKQTNTTGDWQIFDTSRSPTNVASNALYANGSFAEDSNVTNRSVDFLSNGFKIRSSGTFINASGGTFIYMAFAEFPTKFALAR